MQIKINKKYYSIEKNKLSKYVNGENLQFAIFNYVTRIKSF